MSCSARDEGAQAAYKAATLDEWRAAYEAKIADLTRETLRTSALSAALRRLYMGYSGAAKDAGYLPHQIRRYFVSGFPPDEREALLAALPDDEREWVLGDDRTGK